MASIRRMNEMVTKSNLPWILPNFFSCLTKDGESYDSFTFAFAGAWWFFRIYPNGDPEEGAEGFVSIYLFKVRGPPISVECTLGLKTSEGDMAETQYFAETFNYNKGYGDPRFISRSKLINKKSELVPDDILTVLWTLKGQKSTSDASDDVIEKCVYCEENYPFHAERCPDKLITCPACCVEIALRNWCGHECRIASLKTEESLCQALKKTLLEGQNHDLILKVGNKELKAHRDILRARSTVFESIFSHSMKEKNGYVLYVTDCDPKDMEQLLLYMYSGKVESLSQNNMLSLYYIADKFDVQGLTGECCAYIKKSLSHTNICEVIQLASTHCEASLLEKATEYFTNNVSDIVRTVEWQSFLKDNSPLANKLLIKCFKKRKQ